MSEPSMDLVCVACGRDYGAHIGDYCHPPAARSVPPSMFTRPPDPRDAEIAALRAEIEKLTAEVKATRDHDQRLVDQLHDAGGALDDAGVRRHEDDEIASGIEKLAKDRDELLDQWIKVWNLFWPNREPDDGWSADEIGDEVKALRARIATLEADIASRSGTWTRCRCGGAFRAPKQTGMSVPEHTCPGCRRAEVAEDKLAALTPPGHVLVGMDAREAVARELWEFDRVCEWAEAMEDEKTDYLLCADAVLRALGVRGGA